MSIVKWKKQDPLFSSLPSFFDDFWGKDLFNEWAEKSSVPAVNISETDDQFDIEVAAPGLDKEDFSVSMDNNTLTISAEHKESKEEKEGKKVTRKEFSYTSFQRSFSVPQNIEEESIKASYENGVLKLVLPKKEEAKKVAPKAIHID